MSGDGRWHTPEQMAQIERYVDEIVSTWPPLTECLTAPDLERLRILLSSQVRPEEGAA